MKSNTTLGSHIARLPGLASFSHRFHQKRITLKKRFLRAVQKKLCPQSRDFFDAPNLSDDDIFLASFPRSGNTWVRNIISHILYDNHQIERLKDLNHLVPDIHCGIPDGFEYSSPRVIKTHRPYPFRHERHRASLYSKVIYIVRNPFHVFRSYHHMTTKLFEPGNSITLNDFARKIALGAIAPCSWQEHVFSWKAMENEIDILFIKYEDMENDATTSVQRLASFLGRQISTDEVTRIIDKCSRKEMVKLEEKGSLVSPSYDFIRREEIRRTVQEELTPETIDMIRLANHLAMKEFGYE